MGRVVGIDLGTTNSVVAHVIQDRVETIPNPEGAKTTPSVVLFGEDEVVVGELAKRQSVTNHGLVIRSAKRLMGRRYSEVQGYLEDFPYEVVQGNDDRAEIRLSDGRVVPPELVAAQVLTRMALTAEDYIGEEVEGAVITVPAHFNDAQRTATKHAAEIAGLNVLRIINEPTAAALAYGFNLQDRSQKIAVFDFGGGTFDISVLQIQGDIFEVLSTNGDTQLGGDNIDLKLFQEICDGILSETSIDPTMDPKAISRIREASEKAKIELSSMLSTHISLPFIVSDSNGPRHFERELTRAEFNEWIEPILQRLVEPCQNAVKDAHLKYSDLDEIVMVGGSTRIPRVLEIVREIFGKEGNRSINPDEAIAIGASIQAGVMRGELSEVLLLDVTPLSLGIELAGGVFKALIPRNSSIPCEASRKYTTVVDNQTAVTVHVLQGERAKATENRTIARFRLTGIPPMPKELAEIEVTFRIDANGILEVSALELASGVGTGVQVEGYGEYAPMSETEMKKLLDDVERHSKEDAEFIRTANRRAQAERVQDRVNKIMEDAIDVILEADIKKMKETLLRHDLSMVAKDWNMAEQHELLLIEMADKYEGAAEMHRALNRHLDPSGQRSSRASNEAMMVPQEYQSEQMEPSDEDFIIEHKPNPNAAPTFSGPVQRPSANAPWAKKGKSSDQVPTGQSGSDKPPAIQDHGDGQTGSFKVSPTVMGKDSIIEADHEFDPTAIPPPPPPKI